MSERKMIYLCLAHMSEEGVEQKYVKEAFDTNWVVPLGPNVNGFEGDLEGFVNCLGDSSLMGDSSLALRMTCFFTFCVLWLLPPVSPHRNRQACSLRNIMHIAAPI